MDNANFNPWFSDTGESAEAEGNLDELVGQHLSRPANLSTPNSDEILEDFSDPKDISFKYKSQKKRGLLSRSQNRQDSIRFSIPTLETSDKVNFTEDLDRSQSPTSSTFADTPKFSDVDPKSLHDQDWDDGISTWDTDVAGRKVVYDNFTAIDWNYDFSAERIRKRQLLLEKGFIGYLKQIYDASQAWIIVLFLGIGCGIIAGFIDIVSEWLADLRMGYCTTAFYNNLSFCCWEYEDYANCKDWHAWSWTLGIYPTLEAYISGYLVFIISSTTFATISASLVYLYAPYASGSGLPEVKTILGGFIIRGFLGKWTLIVKSLGLCLSVGSGLCLGKEGPLVHVACCVGNFILRFFPKYRYNEAKKREILSAAASAGIAVAFGAPIGGVLFSLEEVSSYFPYKTMWRSFFSAMTAAVTLKWINPFRTFKLVLFQVSYTTNWHGFEMTFFLLLGIIGGVLGAFFIRLNLKISTYRQASWLSQHPVFQVASMAVITACIGYSNKFMRMDAAELLSNLFKECESDSRNDLCDTSKLGEVVFELFMSGIVKFVLAIFTFGLDIPAGFYMPAMMVGACLGRVMGIGVRYWQNLYPNLFLFASCTGKDCVSPATYAMVGAAAMMGGITRMTVSLVIIMFELTGALTYVLPIMMAVMTSKWVGDAFEKGGLTDGLIRLNGYPFLDQKEDYFFSYTAGSVMTRVEDLISIPATGASVKSLYDLLGYTTFKGFPVVRSTSDLLLIGYISRSELRAALEQASRQTGIDGTSPCIFDLLDGRALAIMESSSYVDMRYWTDHTPLTAPATQSMEMVVELFVKLGLRYLLITKHGKLLGAITKKDVLRHLNFVNHPELTLETHGLNTTASTNLYSRLE